MGASARRGTSTFRARAADLPAAELLATSADDGTARIWDPRTGRLLATRAHPGPDMQVWWSRDGHRLFTVNHGGTLRT